MTTENAMQYGRNEFGATGRPRKRAMPSGLALAAASASAARYGPRNTVPTVVLNALLAQSYIAQPRISRRSSVEMVGRSVAMG